jgi:hypothetical protein
LPIFIGFTFRSMAAYGCAGRYSITGVLSIF